MSYTDLDLNLSSVLTSWLSYHRTSSGHVLTHCTLVPFLPPWLPSSPHLVPTVAEQKVTRSMPFKSLQEGQGPLPSARQETANQCVTMYIVGKQ